MTNEVVSLEIDAELKERPPPRKVDVPYGYKNGCR
jgi:hypothetical protein